MAVEARAPCGDCNNNNNNNNNNKVILIVILIKIITDENLTLTKRLPVIEGAPSVVIATSFESGKLLSFTNLRNTLKYLGP
jgi:hypothetical protein